MTAGSARLRSSSQTRREGPSQERIRILVRGLDCDDEAVRQRDVERPMLRLDVEREPALVAPALQFHQPIALAGRVALRQRQAARLGEDAAEEDGLVVDRRARAGARCP